MSLNKFHGRCYLFYKAQHKPVGNRCHLTLLYVLLNKWIGIGELVPLSSLTPKKKKEKNSHTSVMKYGSFVNRFYGWFTVENTSVLL